MKEKNVLSIMIICINEFMNHICPTSHVFFLFHTGDEKF